MTGVLVTNPLFLWMLPLSALPVVFHFFLRAQKRVHVFPSLMFFIGIDPKLSARRKLRQWLILLLRVLAILFVLLALARPVWIGAGGRERVDMVLLIDNSGSMQGLGNTSLPKLREATDAAQALVRNMKDEDSAGIVLLVDDPTVTLPCGLSSDPAVLQSALSRITETEATGTPAEAMNRAFRMRETGSATRFEIHVFTDLQETEWKKRPGSKWMAPSGTSITVYRFSTKSEEINNVCIKDLRVSSRRVMSGRAVPVRVMLQNTGSLTSEVHLNSVDDSGNKTTQSVVIPPHEQETVSLLLYGDTPGFHAVNLWVEGDEFSADNRAGLAFYCEGGKSAFLVGSPDEFRTLSLALSPSGTGSLSGIHPAFVRAEELRGTLADTNCVFLAVTWECMSRLADTHRDLCEAIHRFVEQGGNLLIVPSVGDGGHASGIPDWIGCNPGKEERNHEGYAMMVFDKRAEFFDDLRDERGSVLLSDLRAFRFSPLMVSVQVQELIGLGDGRVLVAQRGLGLGKIYASGIAFRADCSTIPLRSGFVVLMQNMALARAENEERLISLVAGARLRDVPGNGGSVYVRSVVGSPLNWNGNRDGLPVFSRAGVYAIRAGTVLTYVSVRSSDGEGQTQFISQGPVPALGDLVHTVAGFDNIRNFLRAALFSRRALDFHSHFLLLAVLALLVEGWMANQQPRKPAASRDSARTANRRS